MSKDLLIIALADHLIDTFLSVVLRSMNCQFCLAATVCLNLDGRNIFDTLAVDILECEWLKVFTHGQKSDGMKLAE